MTAGRLFSLAQGSLASPARPLIVTMATVFVVELVLMLVLPQTEPHRQAFLDASILSLILLPVVYFTIYRPARRHETERRLARDALRESEERFRQVFEQAGDALFLADASTGRLLDVNDRACLSLGLSRQQLLDLSLSDLAPAFSEGHFEKLVHSLEPGKPVTVETTHRRNDGSVLPVEVQTGLIDIGGRRRVLSVARDITERQRTEEAIVTVATGTSSSSGRRFVRSLALALARALKADGALIGELGPGGAHRIRTSAACIDGQLVEDFEQDLAGTPCEDLTSRAIRTYPSGVRQLFPRDRLLAETNADGYVGTLLFGETGEAIGIAAVLYRAAVPDVRLAESLLQVFALRAVTELERGRSQRAEQESAERFRSLSEAAFEGIAISDGDTLLEANEQLARMLGFSREELVGMRVDEVVPPDPSETAAGQIRSGDGDADQLLARRKDGSTFPVETQGRSMPYRGRTVRVTAIRDITSRREMEQALQESEARYRALFEQGSVAVVLLEELRAIDCNRLALDIFGCAREHLLGSTMLEFSPPVQPDGRPSQQALRERTAAALAGAPQRFEWQHHRLDGTRFDAGITLSRLELDGGPHLQVVLADITKRKESEAALRSSELKYRNLVETSQDLIWQVDAQGRFTFLNKSWEKTHGFAVEDMLGKPFTQFLSPRVADRDSQELARQLAGASVAGHETVHVARSGEELHLVVNAVPVFDTDGKIVGVQGTAYDVTRRKRAEEAVGTLRRRVLKAQEEERRHIARELHDELGQALTGVKMDLAWLASRLTRRPALLERARASISLLDSAMDSVRDLSSRLRPPVLDDLGLPSAIEWQARQFSRRTGTVCDVALDIDDVPLDGDRATVVFRVLQEALTNVTRHADANRVQTWLGNRDGQLLLEVRDDGRGITVDELASTDSLGLIGMRERAAAFGGHVEVRAGEDGGTTVSLRMPLAATPEPGSA